MVEIAGAGISQLDFSAISDYFSRYQISFASENEDEKIRLLTASDILSVDKKPTVGGALVFGINPEKILPQAGIAFAHFSGNKLGAELFDKKKLAGVCQDRLITPLLQLKRIELLVQQYRV